MRYEHVTVADIRVGDLIALPQEGIFVGVVDVDEVCCDLFVLSFEDGTESPVMSGGCGARRVIEQGKGNK